MFREEVEKLKINDKITPLIGPKKGKELSVLKIKMDSGAYNGWVTCTDGQRNYLFAGEEISLIKK